MKLARRLPLVAIITAGALAGLTPATADTPVNYVALGDSYAAGVGITNILDTACSRSDRNYAHLLAARRGYQLTDVTCGGATTESVTNTQLSALTPDTTLVTLGVGGNDIGFTEIVTDCVKAGTIGSGSATGSTSGSAELLFGCKTKYGDAIPTRIAETSAKLTELITDIRTRAPRARVVLVGYPKILPDDASTCAGVQPVLPADVDWARDAVIGGLNTMLRTQANTEYVSIYELYDGHDVCRPEADRWINGTTAAAGDGAKFHPRPAGHAAAARHLAATL
ncbi:SGNH/GDSL hydrolase family protein [Nocardia yamanashiensis]|uniref:SGNH/GDSL hydrolase family protein n=1 Tax=Nocardia yamanashiensis TaxID=209247 RepID=UPI001E5651DC|nr:SGNH/GDSL hydrolase family protein [Nocardia yamanashiensis]UGT45127.1 SGNH/GDSL hydrolase family protein [Nocardia yamanashiensis]